MERRVKELEKEGIECKQAEEALQESEDKYRTLLGNVVDGDCIYKQD